MRMWFMGTRTAAHGVHVPHRPTQSGGLEPGRRASLGLEKGRGLLVPGFDLGDESNSLSATAYNTNAKLLKYAYN